MFCLCWVFFFLKYTLCGETYNLCPEVIANNSTLEDVLFWIGYFNSMINPFLYNFTNQDFRKAFKTLLGLKPRKDKPVSCFVRVCCFFCRRFSPSSSRSGSVEFQTNHSRKTTLEESHHLNS